MRASITIIIFLLFSLNCFAQDAGLFIIHDAMKRWQDTGKLIYLIEELSYGDFQDVLMKGKLYGGDSETRKNRLFLTKADRSIIQEKLDRARSARWKDSLFNNSKGFFLDTLQAILYDKARAWPYFHQYIGKGYFQFSEPLFIRKGSYTLLAPVHMAGNSSGYKLLYIYKKDGTVWKRYIMMPLGAW